MDRIFELGRLFDAYGVLLTERQQNVVDQYANENCSLAEIAEREGISRQAVRDLLVRSERTLHDYEEKLHLCERASQQRTVVGAMARRFHDVAFAPAERDAFDGYLLTLTEIWED